MSVSFGKKAEKNRMMRFFAYLVPTKGLEPPTYALRVRCTTNCAKSAFSLPSYCNAHHQKNQSKIYALQLLCANGTC